MKCPITKIELDETNSKEVFDVYGKKVLVHKDVETKKCTVCGKEHAITDEDYQYLIYDDNMTLICQECQKKYNYIICVECNSWVKKSDTKKDHRNYHVCKTCLENNYVICADCGKMVHKDDTTETHYGTKVCATCKRNYVVCSGCGKLLRQTDVQTTEDSRNYCADCFVNNTRTCADCGRVFSNTSSGRFSRNTSGEEIWYCHSCSESHIAVHQYGYKPVARFKKNDKDTDTNKEFFGSEIEVSGSQSYAEAFINTVNSSTEEHVYLKSDSSICGGGFEIVTQPMSRNYIYDTFKDKLESGMSYLDSKGFQGHNKGGIHIHVSKDALTNKQIAGMINLLYTNSGKIKQLWLTLTQRQAENMQWGSINTESLVENKKSLMKKILNGNYNWKSNAISNQRYTAMNIASSNKTVEFRIFNSSTRIERILKNYEIIFSLIDFTNTDSLPTHMNYLKYIAKNQNKYKYLYEFCVEKELIKVEDDETKVNLFVA